MPKVEAHFHFDVNDLEVRSEMLGRDFAFERDGYPVVLRVPGEDDDFSYFKDEHILLLGGYTEEADGGRRHNVLVIRVSVTFAVPWPGGPGGSQRITESEMETTFASIRAAADVAKDVTADFLHLVRTLHGQHWLAPSGYRPEPTYYTQIRDTENGELLNTSYTRPLRVYARPGPGLGLPDQEAIVEALARPEGSDVPLETVLLADARYAVGQADPARPREAVLLAAIACEVAIKRSIQDAAAPDARPVVDWALDEARFRAASLFDTGAEAVSGRSLRTEDKELYKAVEALFSARNAIAHGGARPDPAKVRDHMNAAVRGVKWTETLAT